MEGVFKEHAVKFMFDPANGIVKIAVAPLEKGKDLQVVTLVIDLKELSDGDTFLEGAVSVLSDGVLAVCDDVKASWQDAKNHDAENLPEVPPGVTFAFRKWTH